MLKQKSTWNCRECGHTQLKWSGQCPLCKNWNTFDEERDIPRRYESVSTSISGSKALRIHEIDTGDQPRFQTQISELDRLLGGGVVKGSLILVGGEPGIGKSTLLLQAASLCANQGLCVLYVCAEESLAQTTLRAARLNIRNENLYLFSETNFLWIKQQIESLNPDVLVIDSIQILYKNEIPSSPGSVAQVRECTTEFMHLAKMRNMATFLIGHVTKSGEIAGPRLLEHIVDTVLYFEGETQNNYRLMRATKNRFGPTDEIALFSMHAEGLKEIENPSRLFLEERRDNTPGSAIIPTLEGSRPFLVEIQALVTESFYTNPTRRSAGIDPNRLALSLAVLEKKGGYQLYSKDIFVSVTGGIRIMEPAADLSILTAIVSSLLNRCLKPHLAIFGEVGLSGDVRSANRVEQRLKELIAMGFTTCILPARNLKGLPSAICKEINLKGVEKIEEGIHAALA